MIKTAGSKGKYALRSVGRLHYELEIRCGWSLTGDFLGVLLYTIAFYPDHLLYNSNIPYRLSLKRSSIVKTPSKSRPF